MKKCLRCSKAFVQQDPRKDWVQKYCSFACGKMARWSRIQLQCRQCGQSFYRKRYMKEWSKERGPFCGFVCYGKWQKIHTKGQRNPNWVSQSNRRGAGQWVRNRVAALKRDRVCVRCGLKKRLHVHHLVHWSHGQKDPHALDNLQTLCASCHRKQHPVPHAPTGRFHSTH